MRVTRVQVDRWRNLTDLAFDVPPESSLISLVGSNGTGKTNMLELLSWAAANLGLAAGVRSQQRQAPPDGAQFHLVLSVGDEVDVPDDLLLAHVGQPGPGLRPAWDRTLVLWYFGYVPADVDAPPGYPPAAAGPHVLAGGVLEHYAHRFANAVIQAIHQRLELNHLFLDADRSYGPVILRDEEILAAAREEEEPNRTRQRAISATPNMYQEWLRDSLGLEHRHAQEFAQAHRDAQGRGEPGPAWEDPWTAYREAIAAILPHLTFIRPDQGGRTLLFRVGGQEVPYHELSGGEREVAFLTGQILRFGLRRGVLLLDEPELHLNAELLERWLSWAAHSVTDGQVWIATHSLEAVEVAGPNNALVLERDPDGLVRRLSPLSTRPIMSTLSGALGAPAFSLDRQRFVLIEGERPGVERVRFSKLCPGTENLFLEAGNCDQVLRKLGLVQTLAEESDRLHIGGVIDRDHWGVRHRRRFEAHAAVHILQVHEIENFFLMPAALEVLARRNGDLGERAAELLRAACDRFGGLWVAQRAALRHDIDLGPDVRRRAGELTWDAIDANREAAADELSNLADLGDASIRSSVRQWITNAITQYADVRVSANLWKECSGKQVLARLAPEFGLDSADAMERQVLQLIAEQEIDIPPELAALREYIVGISAAGV